MKKVSKYDKMFDAMREVLIEYATAKDAEGRWLHKTPEIMRKFGFGNDPKVIDGFNRWLNRQGIYRCPKPKRSERLHIEVETVDTLTPAIEALEERTAELFPPETDADDGDYGQKDVIAAALNRIATELIVVAKAAGLPGYRIISIADPTYGRS